MHITTLFCSDIIQESRDWRWRTHVFIDYMYAHLYAQVSPLSFGKERACSSIVIVYIQNSVFRQKQNCELKLSAFDLYIPSNNRHIWFDSTHRYNIRRSIRRPPAAKHSSRFSRIHSHRVASILTTCLIVPPTKTYIVKNRVDKLSHLMLVL